MYDDDINEYENLDEYNGHAAHDMNVDFDRYMYTGEGAELFEEYPEDDDEDWDDDDEDLDDDDGWD